ncbi:prephenate dehydrogenase dimerization domain-containing protein [Rhodococcus qingshengii]|uniref:prephenate dehydrogenase dimerization domain-containing protein n=1 Tax=Rhodococcus qingshengii TaxID=334542 RepID=UPI001F12E282|nr:prephenate dehydrogenase dimerization domain-containing protein [Rhodococcus qingshengii]ULD38870.1 prephenate dehydrogenase/arogenate dehydrogenase family protein [Rhodococcus qingshengii]
MNAPERYVVVGGAGAVGAMITGLARSRGMDTLVVDSNSAVDGLRADITALTEEVRKALESADVVVLAVPEDVAVAALPVITASLRPGTLLVETLSVKTVLTPHLCGHQDIEIVGINPLFAPSLDLHGRSIAVVETGSGPRSERFLRLLTDRGARLLFTTADEHDHAAATTQALTHAAVLSYGLALSHSGCEMTTLRDFATPPSTMLTALLARMTVNRPEVYWDIQSRNPHARRARAELAESLRSIASAVESDDPAQFAAHLATVETAFGDHLQWYQRICADTFTRLTDDPESDLITTEVTADD